MISKRLRFTDKAIANLKPHDARYEAWDKQRPAFGIRVGESGKKAWFFVYHFNGKARRVTLGQYPQMGLADAGVAYAEARRALEHGNDPGASAVEKRHRLRTMPTIRELGEEYLEKHCRPNKRSSHEDERIFQHDVKPAWGDRKASSITQTPMARPAWTLTSSAVTAPATARKDTFGR